MAALHAGAGQPDGEALGVVIAAVGAFLEGGHAAELGDEDDERVLQQAALLQVAQQRGAGLVEDGARGRDTASAMVLWPSQLPTPSPMA